MAKNATCKSCQAWKAENRRLAKLVVTLRRKVKRLREKMKPLEHEAYLASRAAAREACRPRDYMGRPYG